MADVFDAATRSRIMRSIKCRDTKPELAFAAALRPHGLRARRGDRLPGRPDFVVPGVRLAVFVHGCYWHLCPLHYKPPSGEGWRRKMDANRRRDIRVRRRLRSLGWRTMIAWEHEDMTHAAARVARRARRLADA